MMDFRRYLLHLITRLNAVTTQQLEKATASIKHRSNLFRHLKWLLENGYVTKIYYPAKQAFAYRPTKLAIPFVYGSESGVTREFRDIDILHTLLCSEFLINLSHYPNVTGFAFEYELDGESLDGFISGRRPDVIAQITRENSNYEIAIEVESSLKTIDRVDGILNSYEKTFQKGLYCQGVIIAATQNDIYEIYKQRIVTRPEEFQQKVFLTQDLSLSNLKSKVYGERLAHPRLCCDLIRTESRRGPKYISLNSSSYVFSSHNRTRIKDHQSGI